MEEMEEGGRLPIHNIFYMIYFPNYGLLTLILQSDSLPWIHWGD